MNIPPLAGYKEVMEIMGWKTKSMVNTYMKRAEEKGWPPDMFPKPIQVLASGPVWTRQQIEEYKLRVKRKPGYEVCIAHDCDESFIPDHPRQVYCSASCRDRDKQRRYRSERVKKGLCPKCGQKVEDDSRFCNECKVYYREYQQRRKRE